MSREIKFRAWYTNRNSFYIFGSEAIRFLISKPHGSEVVIEQSTGLKDVNGVEIYEGDIVKLYAEVYDTFGFEITKKETGKIVFNSGAFFISTDTENDPIYAYEDDFEVIGNVHQNMDLLEVRDIKKLKE